MIPRDTEQGDRFPRRDVFTVEVVVRKKLRSYAANIDGEFRHKGTSHVVERRFAVRGVGDAVERQVVVEGEFVKLEGEERRE